MHAVIVTAKLKGPHDPPPPLQQGSAFSTRDNTHTHLSDLSSAKISHATVGLFLSSARLFGRRSLSNQVHTRTRAAQFQTRKRIHFIRARGLDQGEIGSHHTV